MSGLYSGFSQTFEQIHSRLGSRLGNGFATASTAGLRTRLGKLDVEAAWIDLD